MLMLGYVMLMPWKPGTLQVRKVTALNYDNSDKIAGERSTLVLVLKTENKKGFNRLFLRHMIDVLS